LTIILVALYLIQVVIARSHHRAPKSSAQVAAKAAATTPQSRTGILKTSLLIAGLKAFAAGADPSRWPACSENEALVAFSLRGHV
jgi:hypothetical protein